MSASGPVFPGRRVGRLDPCYPTMVMGFNRRWVGQPEYVQVCGDTGQVVQTVREAVELDRRVTVRCGGHCYEDFVCDNVGGVIVDLSPMNGVYELEPDVYCVEGGATLWNVYDSLYREHCVTLPGGSCYSVGVGGHVTGGGYGLLSRLHGLTIDYLYGVEIVCVDGTGNVRAITVNADSPNQQERDLLWANQGAGGGNFGIVTKFIFRGLPAAPRSAELASYAWSWETLGPTGFAELIELYGRCMKEFDPGSPAAGLFALLHLYQDTERSPGITLTMQNVGSDRSPLQELHGRLARVAPPKPAPARIGHHQVWLGEGTVTLPWLFATQTLNGSGPSRRGKYKSAYMLDTFPDTQIEAMIQSLMKPSNPNPAALLQIDSYGCQINTMPSQATAIPQRSSIMKLQYQTYWENESEDPANLQWIRDFYSGMYGEKGPMPSATMDGCYVNYPDVDLAEWKTLYYKDGYPRLQRTKAEWDPLNVFNHQQSIQA